jgi:hypothetical protein
MPTSNGHKANSTCGALCICVLFVCGTTRIAHLNAHPYAHPATPRIRIALGVCTVPLPAPCFHHRKKARADGV